jgi:hypothetical protein
MLEKLLWRLFGRSSGDLSTLLFSPICSHESSGSKKVKLALCLKFLVVVEV